jgi:pimeloyl-ACP methyl ester carboxylesterase
MTMTVKNIVLVHGAWADGSCWSKVILGLDGKGFHTTAVQLPLTSFEEDVAAAKRALALEEGPVVLVGHSYGGSVITEVGIDSKVAGLVYIAAFSPDAGESAGALLASVPPSPLATEMRQDAEGFLKMTRAGMYESFAQDLTDPEKSILFAVHAPTSGKVLGGNITIPAWKTKPSSYVVAANDRAIPPVLEQTMSKKIGAKTTSITSSHLVMLSNPEKVVEIIAAAAE